MPLGQTTGGIQAADQMQDATSGLIQQLGLPNQDTQTPPPPPAPASQPVAGPPTPPPATAPAAQPAPAPQQEPPRRGGIIGMLQAVTDAMVGGRQPTQIAFDPKTGQRIEIPGAELTRGQKWAKLGLEALQGATTAAAAPPGPGHTAEGVAAAVQQQANLQRQQKLDSEAKAEKDFTREQQTRKSNLDYQIALRRDAESTLRAAREGTLFDEGQVKYADDQRKNEHALNSSYLGFVKNGGDLADIGNQDPNFINDLHNGSLVKVNRYDTNNKVTGFEVWRRNPNTDDMPTGPTDRAKTFHRPDKFGDPGTFTYETPDPAIMTHGRLKTINAQADSEQAAYMEEVRSQKKEDSEEKYRAAETTAAIAKAGESRAAAHKSESEAKLNEQMLGGGGGNVGAPGTPTAGLLPIGGHSPARLLNAIVSGQIDINQIFPLSRASSKDTPMGRQRAAYSQAALNLDPTWTSDRFKNSAQMRNEFTIPDNKSNPATQIGSLNTFIQHTSALATAFANLQNTGTPLINKPINWWKTNATGDPQLANVKPLLEAAQTEYQRMLNTHALTIPEMKAGEALLNENAPLASAVAAARSMVGVGLTRTGVINQQYKQQQKRNVPGLYQDLTKQALTNLGMAEYANHVAPGAMLTDKQQETIEAARILGVPPGAGINTDPQTGKIINYTLPVKTTPTPPQGASVSKDKAGNDVYVVPVNE